MEKLYFVGHCGFSALEHGTGRVYSLMWLTMGSVMKKYVLVAVAIFAALSISACAGKGKAPIGKGKAPVVQTKG